jgi:hypothetical protein
MRRLLREQNKNRLQTFPEKKRKLRQEKKDLGSMLWFQTRNTARLSKK